MVIFLPYCKKNHHFPLHSTFIVSTGLWYCMSNFQFTPLKNKTDGISRKNNSGKTSPIQANFKGKSD